MNTGNGYKPSISARACALALGAAALSAGIGCAGTPVPHDRMAQSAASIRAAEEVGAERQPQAQLYLKLARDEVDRAKRLIGDGDNDEARRMLMRAEADAELAIALAKESAARAEAQQALAQIETFRRSTGISPDKNAMPGQTPPRSP